MQTKTTTKGQQSKQKRWNTSPCKIGPSWADLCPASHRVRAPAAVCSSCTPAEQPNSSCLLPLLLLPPAPPTSPAKRTPAPWLHRWKKSGGGRPLQLQSRPPQFSADLSSPSWGLATCTLDIIFNISLNQPNNSRVKWHKQLSMTKNTSKALLQTV